MQAHLIHDQSSGRSSTRKDSLTCSSSLLLCSSKSCKCNFSQSLPQVCTLLPAARAPWGHLSDGEKKSRLVFFAICSSFLPFILKSALFPTKTVPFNTSARASCACPHIMHHNIPPLKKGVAHSSLACRFILCRRTFGDTELCDSSRLKLPIRKSTYKHSV
jgi:hypothetical protein